MELGLQGKRALVAGATTGLGYAIARELLVEGTDVWICGRDSQRLTTAVTTLASERGEVRGSVVDVTDEDAVRRWVEDVRQHWSTFHIIVANAGGPPKGTATQFGLAEYRQALELNLLSSICLVQTSLPLLLEAGWGRIIFVGSRSVREPIPNLALSSTARAGLLGYAKSLVRDLGAASITVNMVAPGRILTERMARGLPGGIPDGDEVVEGIPLGRFGDPGECAAAAAFLASERAGFITGVVLPVDGGIIRAL